MGQRLNVEIHKGGKRLANAYYHWSGYTETAIQMAIGILESLDEITETDDILRAIRMLETTGAGLTDDELSALPDNLKGVKHRECVSRNHGLIAISEKGMETTRSWEEGRFSVDVDSSTVNFDVLWKSDKQEMEAEYGIKLSQVPVFAGNLSSLTLKGLSELKQVVDLAQDDWKGYFLNGSQIYSSIY